MNNQRLFIGIYPGGIVYADREREINGDYARLAFLSYRTLALEIEPKCPAELRERIVAGAARIIAMRGQSFPIDSCRHTVRLGGAS